MDLINLAIILIFLLIQHSFSKQYVTKCPENNGIFPYYSDCQKFISCYDGWPYIQFCAPGTLFDVETLRCDFPNKVTCADMFYESPRKNDKESKVFLKPVSASTPLQTFHTHYTYIPELNLHNRLSSDYHFQSQHHHHHHKHLYNSYMFHNKQINYNNIFSKRNQFFLENEKSFQISSQIKPKSDIKPKQKSIISKQQENRFQSNSNINSLKCPLGYTGLLKHPTLCSKYLNCHQGIMYIQDCSPGTLFNSKYGYCDFPYNVKCQNENTVQSSTQKILFPNENEGHINFTSKKDVTILRPILITNVPTTKQIISNLNLFTRITSNRLLNHDKEQWININIEQCASKCLETTFFECKSFTFMLKNQICFLSDSNVGLSGDLVNHTSYDYYELKSKSMNCDEMFQCKNRKCISKSDKCNGFNDCNDASDETDCVIQDVGYELRLTGTNYNYSGRLEIKSQGEWKQICFDQFSEEVADVICRDLGFDLGYAEINPFIQEQVDIKFLPDVFQCTGNESSLTQCQFNSTKENCTFNESVDLECGLPGMECKANTWQCEKSMECIQINYLCDGDFDCDDKSDENEDRCKKSEQIRISGFNQRSNDILKGRVEIERFGVWGTICDDNFRETEAMVVCKSMGYLGLAQIEKNSTIGPGEGQIWLDQIQCEGTENNITSCIHGEWGDHNCNHDEDVVVICSRENKIKSDLQIKPIKHDFSRKLKPMKYDPDQCGLVDKNIYYRDKIGIRKSRMVHADETIHGEHPWQASIRVRIGKSTDHWCGAVIISPWYLLTTAHCLKFSEKNNYYIEVGDYNNELEEGTEQMLNIESFHIHEQFYKDIPLNNDIGIIKVKQPGIQLNQYVRHICLPSYQTTYTPGMNCTISGWGFINDQDNHYSPVLKTGIVPILDIETCKSNYVYGKKYISDGMLCAGYLEGGRTDACKGDSGGPMVCNVNGKNLLIGIISWGYNCGTPNNPGVYTNVAYYRKWIDKYIT